MNISFQVTKNTSLLYNFRGLFLSTIVAISEVDWLAAGVSLDEFGVVQYYSLDILQILI